MIVSWILEKRRSIRRFKPDPIPDEYVEKIIDVARWAPSGFYMIALGYPALEPRPKLMRDIKTMIHYDDCGEEDFRNIEEVKEFASRARNWNIGTHRRV